MEKQPIEEKRVIAAEYGKGPAALGFFASFENRIRLFVQEKIFYTPDASGGIDIGTSINQEVIKNNLSLSYIGDGEIVDEFQGQKTPRAKRWKRDMDLGVRSSTDPTMFLAEKAC